METSTKKCPSCAYESQCDIILRHHIKGLHKSRETLRLYDTHHSDTSCFCEDCLIEAELKSNLLKHLGGEMAPEPAPSIELSDDYEEEMMEVSVSPELTETIFLEVYDDEEKEGETSSEERQEEERQEEEEDEVEQEEDLGQYVCSKCDFKTTHKSALMLHVRHKHNMQLMAEDVEWFECGYCTFKSLDGDCTVDHVHKVHANQ